MKIRTRLFVGFMLAAALVIYHMVDWVVRDLRPRYLETMEETMVDTATLLAAWVSIDATPNAIVVNPLQHAWDDAHKRRIEAHIYAFTKTQLDMRVYVTDQNGIVLFDSNQGREVGRDYSGWNDVRKTLGGQYGARTTRMDPGNLTSMLYVAAPILVDDKIVGVLTVGKPARSVTVFQQMAQWKIAGAGLLAAALLVLLGLGFSVWVSWPIEKLTVYARAVRDGRKPAPIRMSRGEVGELAAAFDEMREALEGRQYIEDYVRTVTTEMKGPLSTIRGAAELLGNEMPAAERRRFAADVRKEAGRIQEVVDRMLQLSLLENQRGIKDVEPVDLSALVTELVESYQRVLPAGLTIQARCTPGLTVRGERFLVKQAMRNLIQNAVEFSRQDGKITVFADPASGGVSIGVADNGTGIPEGSMEHIFDRFYSMPRPATGKKSLGLGLTFVREAVRLHGGEVSVRNRPEGGTIAAIHLPQEPVSPMASAPSSAGV